MAILNPRHADDATSNVPPAIVHPISDFPAIFHRSMVLGSRCHIQCSFQIATPGCGSSTVCRLRTVYRSVAVRTACNLSN
uniref:ZP domain-containing protein n=1 Tax=Panagrellus redivivus TaxID=6233 RepID=A0A7E5A085_PANRE